MKLLRVIASMDPATGGPCQGIRNSIPALERLGIRNEVVCLDAPAGGVESGDRFPVHALGQRRGPWGHHPALAPWLHEHLSRFDAVLIHGLWLYPSFATWRALRRPASGAPQCLVMPHGMLDPWFQEARPLKAIRNTLYWKLIEHRVIRDATGVLFTCEEERRVARQPFRPYRPKREWVVGYGIPNPGGSASSLRDTFAARFPAFRDRPFLLFLGRIHPKKGVDLLLRAYAQVLASSLAPSPSSVPSLVIAGPCADSAYLRSVQRLATELGLAQGDGQAPDAQPPATVAWLPMLSGEEKWGAFQACEAFILPSHQENFGIAVAEALACGKPVLISNQVNIWREIAADGAGLVAEDTADGTRTTLSRWLALDGRQREAMAGAARRCFEKRFEVGAAAAAMLGVFRRSA